MKGGVSSIGGSTQGHSRAMPYQTESEEKLLLSEELTLSLKRFELVGYSYYFTLFLSFIALFTSKLTIYNSTGIVLHIAIIVYHTHDPFH